jgi:hypothetical protein
MVAESEKERATKVESTEEVLLRILTGVNERNRFHWYKYRLRDGQGYLAINLKFPPFGKDTNLLQRHSASVASIQDCRLRSWILLAGYW